MGDARRERLDLIDTPAAVVDERGIVVDVNRAWRAFSAANPIEPDAGSDRSDGHGHEPLDAGDADAGVDDVCGLGGGYSVFLEDPDDELARRSAVGVFDVIGGRSDHFDLVYPCHAPHEQRWFRLLVVPLDARSAPRQVLTMHVRLRDEHGAREFGVDAPPVRPERSICAWCHGRERLGDRWVTIETPIGPDVAVSHGICPVCAEEQLAEIAGCGSA